MTGDATELQAEINFPGRFAPHSDGDEANVVCVLQCRNAPPAVERDVELPRQAIQHAGVEDVVVQPPRQRAGVDQLVGVDAGGRAGGDIADVVGACSAVNDSQFSEVHQ